MKTAMKKAAKKTAAKAAKPAAKMAAPKKKTAVKKVAAKKKAMPMKKAAPVRKTAAKPRSRSAVLSKKSVARKPNVVAARRALMAEHREQPFQRMTEQTRNNAPDQLEDQQDQHQPMAERPAPAFDPTPDTNVPMRGQTSFHGAQTARVAANKGNRARIGSHRKH